jgi:hypothetical protein
MSIPSYPAVTRLNESQSRLASHLLGCDLAQNEKYLDVRSRTVFSSRPMDQLMLRELGAQLLQNPEGKAAGANEESDLHWTFIRAWFAA